MSTGPFQLRKGSTVRAVVQRCSKGAVKVKGEVVGEIGIGFVVLLGVGLEDEGEDARYLADKIANLRVFPDEEGKLNVSALDAGADILVVSQFTLFGDCRKGRRPSFTAAAGPDKAEELYYLFVDHLRELGLRVATGVFREHMLVEISNDGPVTLLLDSRGAF